MNKKIKPKTILIILALAIGVVLLILGNKNTYCLGFGMIFLGIACFFYAFEKVKSLQQELNQLSNEFYNYKGQDAALLNEYQIRMKFCKKQCFRTKFVFYTFSVLIVVLGFTMFI